METLVLDSNYRPIDIFDWKKALRKVMSERAELLETYVDKEIGFEWKQGMDCPAVIRLLYFVQRSRNYSRYQKLTRKNVLVRDNYTCQYCGCHLTVKNLSWDHVIPRDKGGKTVWNNICACCYKCNRKKANKLLSECGMVLKKKPFAPQLVAGSESHSLFQDLKKLPSESWKHYIYFNVPLNE